MLQDEEDSKTVSLVLKIVGGIVCFLLLLYFWPLTSVGAGQRGVVSLFGKVQDNVLSEGLHVVNPLVSVNKISVQTQVIKFDNQSKGDNTEASSLFSASKDLQDVQIAIVVNYHLPEGSVKTVYQQYQGLEAFQTNVLSPIVREAVKSVSAQYTAEELVTKRIEFGERVTTLVGARFAEKGAVLESNRITNFEFSKQFTEAIELKATAVQNAEAQKNKLEQVKYEAQQQIETAKAQAETIRIQAQAINAQGGADYVQLQAIKAWDGKLPTQMLPGSAVPFLNLK